RLGVNRWLHAYCRRWYSRLLQRTNLSYIRPNGRPSKPSHRQLIDGTDHIQRSLRSRVTFRPEYEQRRPTRLKLYAAFLVSGRRHTNNNVDPLQPRDSSGITPFFVLGKW